jgi:hypothetical protein
MSHRLAKKQSSPTSGQELSTPEIAKQPPTEAMVTGDNGLTRAEQDELAWVRSILDDTQMEELYDEAHEIAVREVHESEAGERGLPLLVKMIAAEMRKGRG